MNIYARQKNRADRAVNGTLLLGTISSEVKLENEKGVKGIFYDVTDQNGLLYSGVPVLNTSGSGSDIGQNPIYKLHSSVLLALISKNSPPIIIGGLQFAPGLLPSSLVNAENIKIQNGENRIELASPKSELTNDNSMLLQSKGNIVFKTNGKFKFVANNKVSNQHPLNGEDAVLAVLKNMTNFAVELAAAHAATLRVLNAYNTAVQAAIATGNPATIAGYAAFIGSLTTAQLSILIPDVKEAIDKSKVTNLIQTGATDLAKDLATTLNKLIELPNNK